MTCKTCGHRMFFDVEKGEWVCKHCSTDKEPDVEFR